MVQGEAADWSEGLAVRLGLVDPPSDSVVQVCPLLAVNGLEQNSSTALVEQDDGFVECPFERLVGGVPHHGDIEAR